jgi:hypothetical protein
MRSYQFWDGLLHYFPGSPLPSATWLSSAPGGQFEVIRLAPGAVCHCRGHDFLDIACRGYRFVIANLHVAVLRDAASPAGIRQFAAIQSAAPSFGVELIPLAVHDGAEIERGVSSNGALTVTARWSMDVPFQRCCHHERLFYTGDRSPFNFGAVHDPARIRVECVASMLGAAIVPWDEIVDSPDVLSGELGLIDEASQLVEQRLGSASSSPTK